jgi:excisionase family DNA binding protein
MSVDPNSLTGHSPAKSRRITVPTSRLVPAKVASRETRIAYTTLRDLVFRGEIPIVKIGRAWYFDRRDLESWIASRKERLS